MTEQGLGLRWSGCKIWTQPQCVLPSPTTKIERAGCWRRFWGWFSVSPSQGLLPLFPGQERFTSMTRLYYRDASACIIMFDVTNATTFSNSQRWKQDLDSKLTLPNGEPVPCLLLANKVCGQSRKMAPGLSLGSESKHISKMLSDSGPPCPLLRLAESSLPSFKGC